MIKRENIYNYRMNKMQSANNICWTVPASLTIFKNTRGK